MKDNYFKKRDQALAESFGRALCSLPLYYHVMVIGGERREFYSNHLDAPFYKSDDCGITLHECYLLTQKQIVDLVKRFSKYHFIKPLSYGKKD